MSGYLNTGKLKLGFFRIIGPLIFLVIFIRIDWHGLRDVFINSNIYLIAASFLLSVPQICLKSFRWNLLLKDQGYYAPFNDLFLYYGSSIFLGAVTPGRVGEFAKALYLKQDGISSVEQAFSSVLIDRCMDLCVLSLCGAVGLMLLDPFVGAMFFGGVGLVLLLFIFLSVFGLSIIRDRFVFFFVKVGVICNPSGKLNRYFEDFANGINHIKRATILLCLLLTVGSYVIFFLQCYWVAQAVLLPLSYCETIQVMALTNLLTFIPVTISGIGTREAALIFLLNPIGVGVEHIVAYSMGILLVFHVGGGLLGSVCWWLKPVKLGTSIYNSSNSD